jgi:hypothetical protein
VYGKIVDVAGLDPVAAFKDLRDLSDRWLDVFLIDGLREDRIDIARQMRRSFPRSRRCHWGGFDQPLLPLH